MSIIFEDEMTPYEKWRHTIDEFMTYQYGNVESDLFPKNTPREVAKQRLRDAFEEWFKTL